jgi:hypothetical protein
MALDLPNDDDSVTEILDTRGHGILLLLGSHYKE